MNIETFKEKIYEPYNQAWQLIKFIQNADQTSDSDEQWQRYRDKIDNLREAYPDNKFVEHLIRFLYDAGDVIAKENRRQ